MRLNFTQKAYLSGAIFYLIIITVVLSVFQPGNSGRTAISEENKIEKVMIQDHQNTKDIEPYNTESIIPFISKPIETCFQKVSSKGNRTLTKL